MNPCYLAQFLSRSAIIQDCRTINTYLGTEHCWSSVIDGSFLPPPPTTGYINTSDGNSREDNELSLLMNAIKLIMQPDPVLVCLETFQRDSLPAKQSQDCSLRFMNTEIAFLQYWGGAGFSLITVRRPKILKEAKHEPQCKPRHVYSEVGSVMSS